MYTCLCVCACVWRAEGFLCKVYYSAGQRPKNERLIKHGGQTNNGPIEDLDPDDWGEHSTTENLVP